MQKSQAQENLQALSAYKTQGNATVPQKVRISEEARNTYKTELGIKKIGTEITKGSIGQSQLETSVNGTHRDGRISNDRPMTNHISQDYGSVMSPNSPTKLTNKPNLMQGYAQGALE